MSGAAGADEPQRVGQAVALEPVVPFAETPAELLACLWVTVILFGELIEQAPLTSFDLRHFPLTAFRHLRVRSRSRAAWLR